MKITPEILKQIQEYAAILMSPREIAILLDLDIENFVAELKNPHSPIYKTFQKEVLKRKATIKKKVLTLAEMGSPQAQTLAYQYLTDLEVSHATEYDY